MISLIGLVKEKVNQPSFPEDDAAEVGPEQGRLVALYLTVLDGLVIQLGGGEGTAV